MLMLKPEQANLRARFGARLKERELLAPHTTFRIGGPADLFVRAESREELIEFAMVARTAGQEVFILGNGSNVLVSDAGVRGLVIENHANAFVSQEHWGELQLTAESGASLPGLANRMARKGWSGLEWAIGVPSTIGAAVVGNAGAHGGSIGDALIRAEVMGANGAVEWLSNAELEFGYRISKLKTVRQAIVLQAEFRLKREEASACIERMSKFSEHRRKTQPTEPSVGSMFKNPRGDFAGRLIDAAGLKGTRIGQVEVSPVHANFFVNRGGATAREVKALIEVVRDTVRAKFGVELELEIQLVGQWVDR